MLPEKRSRRGCRQCRRGHHKCDEATPVCGRCRVRDFACDYPSLIKWNSVATVGSVSRGREHAQPPRPRRQSSPYPTPCGGGGGDDEQAVQLPTPPSSTEAADVAVTSSPVFLCTDEVTAYTYFVHHLACELQAFDSLANPYRRLSVFALAHPVLLHTTISCASEHMALHGLCTVQEAIAQHGRAIRSIRHELSQWKPPNQPAPAPEVGSGALAGMTSDQALLAAILLQIAVVAFSSSGPSSAQMHLDSAFHILNELGYLQDPHAAPSFITETLVQRFAIVDVGVCSFQRRRPRITVATWSARADITSIHASKDAPVSRHTVERPSFMEMTGCPRVVFNYLLRILHLAADVKDGLRPKQDIYDDAIALETSLRLYEMENLQASAAATSGAARTHLLAVCRAFTHTALLLLFRRVFAEPTASPRVQHSISSIFRYLEEIPVTPPGAPAGVDSATGLPFYLAAREAITAEHRDWIRHKHEQWRKKYSNPSRVRLMELAEALWLERDGAHERADSRCDEIEISCESYIF